MAARSKKPKAPPDIAAGTPLYQEEYEDFVEAMASTPVRRAFKNYLNARRLGAGETALSPSIQTFEQIQIIRGKAQAFMELLAMCDIAEIRSKQKHDEGD